jgi:hypothetical protein
MLATWLGFSFGCGDREGEPGVAAEISAFTPPLGSMRPGNQAAASVRIRNTGTEARRLFIGYSVKSTLGEWQDAPASPIELGPGEESEERELLTPPLETAGYYTSRVSVWSEKPGAEEARRLADREAVSTFWVSNERENFNLLRLGSWEATSRKLGRGRLVPENVSVEDGRLRVTLPGSTRDGGEIESRGLYGPGFYAARIKVPDAPSSITGFFLYNPPDFESEIDVEIFNDPSGEILFTTYAGGEQTHTEEERLPFDPTQEFHDYAFFYDQGSITFYVDGKPMKRYEGGLPDRPMRLYVNSWYPTWLDGKEPDSDRHVYVDWFEH